MWMGSERWLPASQRRGLELAEPGPFRMAGKHACLLFWEETLTASSKDACYINILEKGLWGKRQSVPYS